MKGIKLVLLFSIFCFLGGCSGLKEASKGFLGVSTKVLEDKRKEAVKKDFSGELITMHNKIIDILKKEGSCVYRDDKILNLIAFYFSEEDTTPVGIFLTEVEKDKTRIEVASPSTYAKEYISNIIFTTLDGTRKPKDEKGKADAEKQKLWGK